MLVLSGLSVPLPFLLLLCFAPVIRVGKESEGEFTLFPTDTRSNAAIWHAKLQTIHSASTGYVQSDFE